MRYGNAKEAKNSGYPDDIVHLYGVRPSVWERDSQHRLQGKGKTELLLRKLIDYVPVSSKHFT